MRSTSTGGQLPTPHGFADDDLGRLLRRRPHPATLAWVEEQTGAEVIDVRALRGGTSSAVHALRLSSSDERRTVVLRSHVRREVIEDEPDLVDREAHVLGLLTTASIETPVVLASDPAGARCPVPSILMSRVPGRLEWSPTDLDPWLHRLVDVLPVIHDIAVVPGAVQSFRGYPPRSRAAPPWLDPALWDRALAVFDGPVLDPDAVFIHRDFHPGNVLWRRGRVSGVVDWPNASIGPRTVDVVHCRTNLTRRFGMEVADRFSDRWQEVTGDPFHPWAEIVLLVDAIGGRWLDEPSQRAMSARLARRLADLGA